MSLERDENRSLLLALAGCGLASLLAVSTAVALIRHGPDTRAHMGDVVAFNRPVSDALQPVVMARRAGGGTCVMNPATLTNGGGSLVVEGATEGPTPLFRVHWAGPRTASSGGCGRVADLLLDEAQLNTLSMAAGGYGVDHKIVTLATPMPAMALALN